MNYLPTLFLTGVKSWSYPAAYVTLTSGGIDTDQMLNNDEWEMMSSKVKSDDVTVGGTSYR